MVYLRLIGVFLAGSLLASAADVKVYPAKDVDLSVYKTYKILPPKVMTKHQGLVDNEPTVGPVIAAALRKELTAKGLTEVTTSEQADLEIASLGASVPVPQVESLIYSIGTYDPAMPNSSIIGTAPIATIGRYNKEGTLYVNMIDPKTNKTAWLGISTQALGKPENLNKDVDKAAKDLFKKYPSLKEK